MNMKAILSQRLVKTQDGGRKVAVEIMVNTPRISDLIEKWDISEIKESMANGKNYKMQTFDQCLLQLWKDGFVSEEEALVHADAINDLRLKIKMSKLEGSDNNTGNIDELSANASEDLKI